MMSGTNQQLVMEPVGEMSVWDVGRSGMVVNDRRLLEGMFAEMEVVLGQASRLLSPYEAHMAAFHLRLLRQEMMKMESDGRPSADILMMAGTWLLMRVNGLEPLLLHMLHSESGQMILRRAGETAVNWAEARRADYEVENSLCG